MSKVNLSYNEHVVDTYEYDLSGKIGAIVKKEHTLPENYIKFFNRNTRCPYCTSQMNRVFEGHKPGYFGAELYYTMKVNECICGYWYAKSSFSEELDLIDEVQSHVTETKFYSVIKSLEDCLEEKMIRELIAEINRDNKKVYKTNPKSFEKVVQYILSSYFACEVEHVGKSHDGGVDLLLINSEQPTLVQVKRRENPNHVEGISTTRDLLGAMYIKNNYNGIIVSTAKSFSIPTSKTIAKLKNESRLDFFELIDLKRLLDMMKISPVNRDKCWNFLTKGWDVK